MLAGFWWAVSGSQIVQAIVIVYLIARIDWSLEVENVGCETRYQST